MLSKLIALNILLCLLCIVQCSAQDPYLTNWYNEAHPQELFEHYFNLVKINGVPDNKQVTVLPNNDLKIIRYLNHRYYVQVLNKRTNSLSILIDKKIYKCNFLISNNVPLPDIQLSNKVPEGGNVTRLDSVICKLPFTDKYNKKTMTFKIRMYDILLYKKGELFYHENIIGNQFSKEVRKKYNTMFPSDSIVLRNVILNDSKNNKYVIKHKSFQI